MYKLTSFQTANPKTDPFGRQLSKDSQTSNKEPGAKPEELQNGEVKIVNGKTKAEGTLCLAYTTALRLLFSLKPKEI